MTLNLKQRKEKEAQDHMTSETANIQSISKEGLVTLNNKVPTKLAYSGQAQSYNMDIKSKINSWWAKGATKKKTMEPTMEKTQKELQNPLPDENQPTICLICDQTFESKKHCLEHIQILHGLQNSIENYHYKIKSHSEENSINSINPAPSVKLDEQGSKDGTTKPKPKVATTHTKTKRPNYPITQLKIHWGQ